MDQLQRSLMLQQQNAQLLASSVGASSNVVQLPFQQQQLQPLDPLLQHTLQARQQLQLQGLPPPRMNSTGMASANVAAAQPTRHEESKDEEQSEPEDDSGGD